MNTQLIQNIIVIRSAYLVPSLQFQLTPIIAMLVFIALVSLYINDIHVQSIGPEGGLLAAASLPSKPRYGDKLPPASTPKAKAKGSTGILNSSIPKDTESSSSIYSLIKSRLSSKATIPGLAGASVLRGSLKTTSRTYATLKTNIKNLFLQIFPILGHPYFKYITLIFKWLVRVWALFNLGITIWYLYYNGLFPTMWAVWYYIYNQVGVIFDLYWDGVAKFLDYCNKIIKGGTGGVPHSPLGRDRQTTISVAIRKLEPNLEKLSGY
uniref:Uncharacterized protein n=1 Tax=Coniferiporia sulphurascens TaxID=175648 RepID=A0A5B9RKB3_CONSH|nr:hypothetical protein PSUO_000064 [Coniferiporia sulphurascens]QEG57185.1 hypothetical protein PSUO_000064 [Coniferiporia sulphurascens]